MRNENLRPRIFDALCGHPYGLTMNQMLEAVYPDPDREPDCAYSCLTSTIYRMNLRYAQRHELFRIRGSKTDKRYRLWIVR